MRWDSSRLSNACFGSVHFYTDDSHTPLVLRLDAQTLTILHGPLDSLELVSLYQLGLYPALNQGLFVSGQ